MKQLSDLLWEAKADAPPMRYDVDDVVAAGRRRRYRRTATWAVAVAVVVATAGVALVVPRGPAAVPTPPVATSPAPSAVGSFYDYSFRGFSAAGYQVTPDRLLFGVNMAEIYTAGSHDLAGFILAYQPGVEPGKGEGPITDTEPINGHRAYWVGSVLHWEYADGALAVVASGHRGATDEIISRADLRSLATAFVPGGGPSSRVAMRVGYLPAKYRLVTVWEPSSGSWVELVPESDIGTPSGLQTPAMSAVNVPGVITITVMRPDGLPHPKKLTCGGRNRCEVVVGGGYHLTVQGPRVAMAEIEKVAKAVTTVADPGNRDTWLTPGEAFPTSALLTGIK
ncbi:hypothetical protein [Actinoplanes regularis]|uniref:Uncharacterized protein n=1 Tax=Actinoplanes regularis TaxID=52697 RepID=A0A239C9P2_9ACTN|nr:hypothetical protein [Actinoplanes regularis]GIE89505.1 hypothetical protein Are01nite_59850 [Actinoplanes regularis]SNS16966.1 hypothetical protein SAMN06264365_11163 [Actinoplanes regularis]